MYASFPQFVFGFHGCDRSIGEALINSKARLIASNNPYDWLGSGIYFWENSFARALNWAKECSKNPKITKGKVYDPFVVGAIIDLGKCLNLTDQSYNSFLRESYDTLKETYEKLGIVLPKNSEKAKMLDCIVINSAIEDCSRKGISFDTVRCAYLEGDQLYPESSFYSQTHIQVCVRNPNCIKGYFNPLIAVPEFNIP